MSNLPLVFIDLALEDQAVELRSFFKSLGADITEDTVGTIEGDLQNIINVCDILFKEQTDAEAESVLNDIVSMLVLLPPDRAEQIILSFSEKLTKAPGPKFGGVALRVLWLLFQAVDESCSMRYHVYYHLVQIAKQIDKVRTIFKDVDTLKKQLAACKPTTVQMQKLLRLLHEVLVNCKESELAAKVMMELLSTYTSSNASEAKEDAYRCIIAALADPDTFLLDPLLALKPVHFLKGDLIHDLLTIFVSGTFANYLDFYTKNKDFVEKIGLSHEANMTKMRLLTFMQLAEGSSEMSFDTITTELQITEDQVESFIIDVLKTKLVRARMDQATRKVFIGSTMHRTFGEPQWLSLRDTLAEWKSNLVNVQLCMQAVVEAK